MRQRVGNWARKALGVAGRAYRASRGAWVAAIVLLVATMLVLLAGRGFSDEAMPPAWRGAARPDTARGVAGGGGPVRPPVADGPDVPPGRGEDAGEPEAEVPLGYDDGLLADDVEETVTAPEGGVQEPPSAGGGGGGQAEVPGNEYNDALLPGEYEP